MSPVWVHLVWAAALALCDLNCAASLQVSLHGRLVSKRHFGHKLSGALIVKINSDHSRCCALSLPLFLCLSPLHRPPLSLLFLFSALSPFDITSLPALHGFPLKWSYFHLYVIIVILLFSHLSVCLFFSLAVPFLLLLRSTKIWNHEKGAKIVQLNLTFGVDSSLW